jgi:ApaG protein
MVTLTTHGVKITVQSNYEDSHSRPTNRYFIFSYRITIENNTPNTIQLLRRHWYIFDSMSGWSEVEGEGVVSQKPILYPSEEYQYESFCPLVSEAGKIYGTYLMENKTDGTTFFVNIPVFKLVAPCKNN